MRRIILFRHAKADPPEFTDDSGRQLALAGKDEAKAMGAWLASMGIDPDLVICSTALRTRQTWSLAAAALDPAPPLRYDERVYQASAADLMALIQDLAADVWTVLLVGHNPGMEELAHELGAAGEPEVVDRLAQGFSTGAIAVLDFDERPWADIGADEGWLSAFATPDQFDPDEDDDDEDNFGDLSDDDDEDNEDHGRE